MLKRIALGFIAALALLSPAQADVAITAGSGTTIFDYICFSTKHCAAVVPTNSGGTEIMTSGNAAYVQFPSAQAVTVSQATSSNLKAQVDPLTAASWGIATATQNSASATLGQLVLGQFNTTPTTITSGNMSPMQLDNAGNLRVNVTAITGQNANGQAAMSGSAPVTTATDQRVSTANASVAINVSTATTTQLVAISGSTKVYVTAWNVIAGGTGNITLVYGTGSSCGTGTTSLTGAYNLTAQAGLATGNGIAPVLIVPSGNALCVTTSANVQMSGSVTYQQF